MNIDQTRRIFGLDLMRAIAISGVLFTHLLWVFPDALPLLTYLGQLSGFMGVEVFFVLSGFLIGRILIDIFSRDDYRPIHWLYFLIRRWFRTLPNYYLALLLNIVIVIYLGRELPDTLWTYFFFLQNAFSGMDIFFTESWSLPIEEFAYLLGPIALYFAALIFGRKKPLITFFWTTVTVIVFFSLNRVWYSLNNPQLTLEGWNIELKAVVRYRIDAIYYGVLFACGSRVWPRFWSRLNLGSGMLGTFLFIGLLVFIGFYGCDPDNSPWLYNLFYLPICSVSVALWLPFLSQWKQAPAWLSKPITFLSVISYSIYLLHYSIVLQLMRYWLPPSTGPVASVLYTCSYFVVTCGLAYLLYRFYEKPMMDLRDSPYFKKLDQG